MQLREWRVREEVASLSQAEVEGLIEELRKETGLSALTLRVCIQRGLKSSKEIHGYLSPRLDQLTHPSRLQDMDLAVDRLTEARNRGELVRVFGDYDVDGTTGAALLSWVLREFGFQYDVRQPDRFKDGYGLNVRAVEEAVQAGARVLLTVDCGITSFEAAARAKALGIDLIIVDHHQLDPQRGLPEAVAVINPQRSDCQSGLKQLCGCGLAFYLSMALRSRGRQEGWFAAGKEPNLKQHLDLVVMATAADMVPLTGDNHILVRFGLEVLKNTTKPGVKALLETAGLTSRDISPSHLGFVLGPRINASGRMQSATLALELLTTQDTIQAFQHARELEKLNQERADIQNQIWDEVRKKIEEGLSQGKYKNGIAVADSGWHEGVVGIVASRVTETFHKPAAVVALREDFGKGSVRSYGGKDVLSALRLCSEYLLGFGGHKHAAGLSVGLDRFEAFSEAFDAAVGQVSLNVEAPPLWIEGECSVEEMTLQTLVELERLGPFGTGNPEPVFAVKAAIAGHQVLKGRHLKLNLASAARFQANFPERKVKIDAIWFHGAEHKGIENYLNSSEEQEWAGVPELNRFRGQATPTLRVKDWRRINQGL